MERSSYLRLALMFGENKASTFNKNLEKMIALVLFDKYNTGLTITDIIADIRDKYALDFSDSEIIGTICNKNQNRIIQINETRDEVLKAYSITPEEYEKIRKKTDDSSIRKIVELFLKEHEELDISEKAFCDLLVKYLYDVFNSNAETIQALMNGEHLGMKAANCDYSTDEKKILNAFIYWDNLDKNRCVYQLISCCFDYCMMTVRKDKTVYQTIFNQKKFYLDTNIVFRLMGLNNEKRKLVIDAFILKCRETGVEILYSNHTRSELNDTIRYYVGQIKALLADSAPLSVRAISCLDDRMSNSAFYEQYVEWTKDPVNRTSDYSSFERDLRMRTSKILSRFKQVTFDDYSGRNKKEYAEQFESLKQYKIEHRRNTYDPSIKADINNYLYIQERNREKKGENFFATDHYLITADHAFSGWEREKRPGAIPTVVLPSVWYSIILQYAGRTTADDYSAFTRFLNFSFSENEPADARKMEILKSVIALQEPVDMKETIIFDIAEKLQHDYKDLNSEQIVETSHQYVINQILAEENEKAKRETAAAVEAEKDKADAQVNALRNEKAYLEQQLKESVEKTKAEQKQKYIDSETDRRTKRRLKIYIVVTGGLVIGFLALILITGKWVFSVNEVTEKVQIRYDYIKYLLDVLYVVVSVVIVSFGFKGLNEDKIRASVRKKLEKEWKE